MTAEEIREYIDQHIQEGAVSNETVQCRILSEIAAHLADLNAKTVTPSPNWPELSTQTEILDKVKALAMRTCNSERDLAVTLESIRHLFYA
jgi:hypothetical protein